MEGRLSAKRTMPDLATLGREFSRLTPEEWLYLKAWLADAARGLDRTDSPIERAFLDALYRIDGGVDPVDEDAASKADGRGRPVGIADDFCVVAQAQIGPFRVDFLFVGKHGRHGLVVECDGHDFHDRTPEQARRDRRRDRELVGGRLPVIRFTGSEINRDAMACAQEALDIFRGHSPARGAN